MIQTFSDYKLYNFFIPLVLQVQRSLAEPGLCKTECAVQPKAAQPDPALSKALARVLSATEAKENEAEPEYPDSGSGDYAEDNKSGKIQRLLAGTNQVVWTRIVMSTATKTHCNRH